MAVTVILLQYTNRDVNVLMRRTSDCNHST